MTDIKYLLPTLLFATLLFAMACSNTQPEKKKTEATVKDTATIKEPVAETKRAPVINISDTLSIKRLVLTMKDSAASMQRISMKLGEIYSAKLGALIKKNNLKIVGSPIAWYKGLNAPYFFEAGMPVDKKPSKLPTGVYARQIGIDSIVVAHFYGPYDLLPQAYDALKDWMKNHKKTPKGSPYEVYIGDPVDENGKTKNPYKVQTDVIWAWK